MNNQHEPPKGMIADSRGRFVQMSAVKPLDLVRHELVTDLMRQVEEVHENLKSFRLTLMSEIESFVQLAASEYDTQLGGRKGNISLSSYDGKLQVKLAISERIVFDERIQVAKELADECIHEWAEGSRDEIKALVDHAFQVDSEGKISLGRVLGLTRVNIKDPKWLRAMDAIRDSMKVCDTKSYVRFYKRISVEDKFQLISLDVT